MYFDISENNRCILRLSRRIDGCKIFRIDGKVSNFKVLEFACKDGSDEIVIDTALVVLLQKIRTAYAQPVIINSAYRTPDYNKKVGGVANSQHVYGKAADIRLKSNESRQCLQLLQSAEKYGAMGLGLYGDFCHVDVRDSKSCFLGTGAATCYGLLHNNSFLPL